LRAGKRDKPADQRLLPQFLQFRSLPGDLASGLPRRWLPGGEPGREPACSGLDGVVDPGLAFGLRRRAGSWPGEGDGRRPGAPAVDCMYRFRIPRPGAAVQDVRVLRGVAARESVSQPDNRDWRDRRHRRSILAGPKPQFPSAGPWPAAARPSSGCRHAGVALIASPRDHVSVAASLRVLTGPPGAGKTTVARLVAGAFDLSVHLPADDFWRFIRAGYAAPWRPESQAQNAVVIDALASAAMTYATGGYRVVLDGSGRGSLTGCCAAPAPIEWRPATWCCARRQRWRHSGHRAVPGTSLPAGTRR